MENVNTLDIDGTQWEITDNRAREDILKLKSDNKVINIGQIDLVLKPGYAAYFAKLQHVMKMGKLITGTIHFIGLEGEGIGEQKPIAVAELPFSPQELFEVVLVDTWQNNSFRASGNTDKTITIMSTGKLIPKTSDIIGSFICFES